MMSSDKYLYELNNAPLVNGYLYSGIVSLTR